MKASGTAAGSVLVTSLGAGSALAKGSDGTVRLRGTLSNPISASKVEAALRQAADAELAGSDPVPTIEVDDMPDHHHVVALNVDVIDGSLSSWAGVVGEPSAGLRTPDSLGQVRRERVAAVHEKAKRNANERARLKQEDTTTQDVTTQTTYEDWSDWNTQVSHRDEIVGSDGNETGYDVKWKADPSNYAHQGVEAEIRMLPQSTDMWTADWQNRWADPYFGFNGSIIDHVADYGPGNSIGSVTETISLSVSSDKVVEVGASSSNTSSNVDIDNHSDTYGGDHYVNQKFSISGDLKWNTVRVNQAACTQGTDPTSGSDYVNMDLDSKYRWGDCCQTHKHLYDYRLYWS